MSLVAAACLSYDWKCAQVQVGVTSSLAQHGLHTSRVPVRLLQLRPPGFGLREATPTSAICGPTQMGSAYCACMPSKAGGDLCQSHSAQPANTKSMCVISTVKPVPSAAVASGPAGYYTRSACLCNTIGAMPPRLLPILPHCINRNSPVRDW